MRNPIHISPVKLIGQGATMAQGAARYGGTIELGPNTAENIRLDVAALEAAIAAYEKAKDELRRLRKHLDNLSLEGRRFLLAARDSLKPMLGYTYNTRWDSTGLVRSLRIPDYQTAISPLLGSFGGFFERNPGWRREASLRLGRRSCTLRWTMLWVR